MYYISKSCFNWTLLSMLDTLKDDQTKAWDQYVVELVQAYNKTLHPSAGYIPYFFMFVCHAKLPIDIMLDFWGQLTAGCITIKRD